MEPVDSEKDLSVHEVAAGIEFLFKKHLDDLPLSDVEALWKEHLMIRQLLHTATEGQRILRGDDEDDLIVHPRTDQDLENFLKWAKKKGIEHDPVDVVRCEAVGGFGLRANRAIEEGDSLVSVPRAAMITSEHARQSVMLAKVPVNTQQSTLWEMDHIVLTIYLLCQKYTHSSPWGPYIKMLPTEFTLPLFYTPEQMQQLKPSPLYEEALAFYRQIARQYCIIYQEVYEVFKYNRIKNKSGLTVPMLHKSPLNVYNFTFDAYRWAVACVTTRMNKIPRLDWNGLSAEAIQKGVVDRNIPCLIPLMDFANHEFPEGRTKQISVGYDDVKLAAGINAHRAFAAGEFTPIFYGARCNIDHLLHNGFVPENNPNDRYRLRLPIPTSDKYMQKKRDLYRKLGYRGPETHAYIFDVGNVDRPIPTTLLLLTKIIVSKRPDGEDLREPDVLLRAVVYLKNRFALLQRQYVKIEEGNTEHKKVMERILRSELEVLQRCEAFCTEWEAELRSEASSLAADAAGLNIANAPPAAAPAPKAPRDEATPPAPDAVDAKATPAPEAAGDEAALAEPANAPSQ